MKTLFALLAVALIAGCASVTQPVGIGVDRYEVSSKMGGPGTDWGSVKRLALAEASKHCASQGKVSEVEKEDFSGALGWTPIEAHIKYRCVDAAK